MSNLLMVEWHFLSKSGLYLAQQVRRNFRKIKVPQSLLPSAAISLSLQKFAPYPNPAMSPYASLIRPLRDCIHVDSEVQHESCSRPAEKPLSTRFCPGRSSLGRFIASEMKLLWVVVGYHTAVSYVSAQPVTLLALLLVNV
jgi:hypothetical protein